MRDIRVVAHTQESTPRQFDLSYLAEVVNSFNYLIGDVRNPDKINATFSKTINLPGSAEVNQFFEWTYMVNTNKQYFNPNLKCKLHYYLDGVEILRGDLQLLKINYNDDLGYVESYEVSIIGSNGQLFVSLAGKTFADLDFSEYNHNLTKSNVINSWATSIIKNGVSQPFAYGSGYVYGLIDYGYNQVNPLTEFHVKHFRPQVFKKTILNKVMALAGYTISPGGIFDSTDYLHEVVPFNYEQLYLTASAQANASFLASRTFGQSFSGSMSYISGPGQNQWYPAVSANVVIFNNDSTSPNNDPGNQYNTLTGELTIAIGNDYDMFSEASIDVGITPPAGAVSMSLSTGGIKYKFEKNSGSGWVSAGSANGAVLGTYTSFNITLQLDNILKCNSPSFNSGDKLRVVIDASQCGIVFLNSSNNPITTGTASAIFTVNSGSNFYAKPASAQIIEGAQVNMNAIIDGQIKLTDWLLSEFKLHNVFMEVDKLDEKKLILETRENFYSYSGDDWTHKRDYAFKSVIKPMGELSFRRYEYTYKTDTDDYNKQYFDEYKEVYGCYNKDITNDFVKEVSKIELIYAATPIVGNVFNGLITPRLYKLDNGVVKPTKTLPRSLYYAGLKSLSVGSWTLKSSSGDQVFTSYPFVGDCDDTINPTLTMNWGSPRKIFYFKPQATYTTNDLYNRYYSRQINQLSDKNSCIVTRNYALTPLDIYNFSFRKIIFDLDTYFYVNKISDVDPNRYQSVQVELLKLADYQVFTPATIGTPQTEEGFSNRTYNGGNYIDSNGNVNYGDNSIILGGSNNYIPFGARGVQLINSTGVTVQSNVVDFVGTNLNDSEVSPGQTQSVGRSGYTVYVDHSVTIDNTYHDKMLIIDALSNITITIDEQSFDGCVLRMKRIDGTTNEITLTSLSGGKINGVVPPVVVLVNRYSSLELTSDSTNIYTF